MKNVIVFISICLIVILINTGHCGKKTGEQKEDKIMHDVRELFKNEYENPVISDITPEPPYWVPGLKLYSITDEFEKLKKDWKDRALSNMWS